VARAFARRNFGYCDVVPQQTCHSNCPTANTPQKTCHSKPATLNTPQQSQRSNSKGGAAKHCPIFTFEAGFGPSLINNYEGKKRLNKGTKNEIKVGTPIIIVL
jgi:hypothetical protein